MQGRAIDAVHPYTPGSSVEELMNRTWTLATLCVFCLVVSSCGGGGGGGGIGLSAVDPGAGYSGMDTDITIRGDGFESPTAAYLLHPTTSDRIDLANVVMTGATEITASVPAGGVASTERYDLRMEFGGSEEVLEDAFLVSDSAPPAPTDVSPPSGWDQQTTRITILGEGFVSLPRIFLQLGAGSEVEAENVLCLDETILTATVPAGLAAGLYGVIVQNPDTLRGSVADVFEISVTAPPSIDSVAPTSMPATAAGTVTISGEFFSGAGAPPQFPGVYMSNDPGDPQLVALTVTNVTAPDGNGKQQISASYDGTSGIGAYVVTVINFDGQRDAYASLKLSSSADGKLGDSGPFTDSGRDLTFPRRRMGGASGGDDLENDFVYIVGGDDGTDALRAVEYSLLSPFGGLGKWRATRRLNSPRTSLGLVSVDHPTDGGSWLFAIGGSTDGTSGNALGTIERARVLTQTTVPQGIAATPGTGGTLPDGPYFYRVSAVTAAGEEWLATSPTSVSIRLGEGAVRLSWDAVPGAAAYHVYRSASAAGSEVRVAESVPQGTRTSPFMDRGLAVLLHSFGLAGLGATEDPGAGTLAAGQWHYQVSAVTVNGEMSPSADASVVVGANGAVTLDWTESTAPEVLYYNIYRSEDVDDTGGQRYRVAEGVLAPPFVDAGLPLILASGPSNVTASVAQVANGSLAAGDYTYAVTAVTGGNESLPTFSAVATLAAPDNAIRVEWDAVEGVDSYTVYRDSGTGLARIREGVRANGILDAGIAPGPGSGPGDGKIAPASGAFQALEQGTLSRWEVLDVAFALSTPRLAHAAQVARLNDGVGDRTFLYVAAGRDSGDVLLDTVERTEVTVSATDGSLELAAWAVESEVLPEAREFPGIALADATAHPGIDPAQDYYLYVVQGSDGGLPLKGLKGVPGAAAAAIDGSLGGWNLNFNDPASPHVGNSAVIGSGSIYVICGIDTTGGPSVDVRRGQLNADGSVSVWADSSAKPAVDRAYQVAIVGSSFLYIIGGETAGGVVTGIVEQIPF
jgi:hypothetical protein